MFLYRRSATVPRTDVHSFGLSDSPSTFQRMTNYTRSWRNTHPEITAKTPITPGWLFVIQCALITVHVITIRLPIVNAQGSQLCSILRIVWEISYVNRINATLNYTEWQLANGALGTCRQKTHSLHLSQRAWHTGPSQNLTDEAGDSRPTLDGC